VKILSERVWRRHSSPWSVWTRILSYPLVYLPFWNRSWKQGAAVAAWFAANPVIFPEPEDDSSWATRGVLGEKLWMAERPRDLIMLLSAASGMVGVVGLVAAYRRRFWPMMLCASAGFLLVLWGIDRYTVYYDQHKEAHGGQPGEAGRGR
jgi:hypothetical protein